MSRPRPSRAASSTSKRATLLRPPVRSARPDRHAEESMMAGPPPVVPRLPTENPYRRDLAPGSAFVWLRAGWQDLMTMPAQSLARGSIAFLVSVAILFGLAFLQLSYILFPALAGFLILGPLLAIGLYAKSRAIERGDL